MILLIDNYDSFSYNLYQLIGSIDPDIKVIRNDEMTVEQIIILRPRRVILSPGPGRPENAGILVEAARELGKEIPTLGVCLGHQAGRFQRQAIDFSACGIRKGRPNSTNRRLCSLCSKSHLLIL